MLKSLTLQSSSCSSALFSDLHFRRSSRVVLISCSSRSNSSIPKLKPFSRSKFDRVFKDPPLIQKSENELADYCSTLKGDESYSCWRAYFELKDLEKDCQKEDIEKLILQAGGVKSLIGCLHGIAAFHKERKEEYGSTKPTNAHTWNERCCPVPDGLRKSKEELDEEEKAKMLDSRFTRLLRTKGRFPAWYSQAPDHETD
ncbi:hypothetical protein RJ641_013712 [Dillenia turbinata]|uniref:CCG-binding protein 1 n=1 Tax=Dillenia turbinata TaxID=194707 RepID=A0AAN8WGM0_9MAGN